MAPTNDDPQTIQGLMRRVAAATTSGMVILSAQHPLSRAYSKAKKALAVGDPRGYNAPFQNLRKAAIAAGIPQERLDNPIAPLDALLSGGMSASEFANTFQRGDRFTILIPAGRGMHGQEWAQKSGKAIMPMKADPDGVIRGWVLNMGGPHGTPGLARYENTVKVIRPGKGRIYQNGFILQSGKPASPDEREGNPAIPGADISIVHLNNDRGGAACGAGDSYTRVSYEGARITCPNCENLLRLSGGKPDFTSARRGNPRAADAPEVLGRIVDAIRSGDEDYSYGAGWESLFSKALAWKDRKGGWMGNAREAQDILVWIGRASVNDDEEYSFGEGWDILFAAARSFVPFLKMPPLGRSAGRRGNPGSFKAEVIADDSGKWCGNALRFATREEAEAYARNLQMRWTAVRDTRVVESDDPPDEPRGSNPCGGRHGNPDEGLYFCDDCQKWVAGETRPSGSPMWDPKAVYCPACGQTVGRTDLPSDFHWQERRGNPELIEARADPRLPSTASERVLGVFRGGHLVGYIRKIHGTDTETFPWQAFHYPMGVRGGGKLLGSFYGPAGKTQATRAVASGRGGA